MRDVLHAVVAGALEAAVRAGELPAPPPLTFSVGPPRQARFGDLACDVALVLGAALGRSPSVTAATLMRYVCDPGGWFEAVEVGGPGYVNFRLAPAFWQAQVARVFDRTGPTGDAGAGCVVGPDPVPEPDVTWGRAVAVATAVRRLLPRSSGGDPRPVWVALPGARGAAARAACRAAGARLVGVGEARVVRRGTPVIMDLAALEAAVGADAARFFLVGAPVDTALEVDADVAAQRAMESPYFAVRWAEVRCARVVGGGVPGSVADLTGLGAPDVPLARVLAEWPDVRADVATTLEVHRLGAFAIALAAAFHGYYNRRPIVTDDVRRDRARVALVQGVGRVLRDALDLLGVGAIGEA
ncbi:MAG: DALR anticodon-binding domain-containing protein [Candidatus Binatia bacterium]